MLEQKVATRLVVKYFWFIFSANILQFGNATYLFWWIVSFVNYDLFCLPLTMSWEWLFLLITHRPIRLWWMLSQPFIRLKLGWIVWTILKHYGLSINDTVSKWAICNPCPVMSFLFHWVSVNSSFGAPHSLPLLMTLFMDGLYLHSFLYIHIEFFIIRGCSTQFVLDHNLPFVDFSKH